MATMVRCDDKNFVVAMGSCHDNIHHWTEKCWKLSTLSLSQLVWNISMWLVCLAANKLQLRSNGCHGEVVMVTTPFQSIVRKM